MNILQLKSFLAVVKTNSFSEASYFLYLSQSNVSKHIISLEKEFSQKLFKRQGRHIELTEFGHYFNEQAESILNCYSHIKDKARHLQDLHAKTIRVVSIPILWNYAFADLFERFKEKYKDITLTLTEREPADVIDDIKSEHYDYAIVRDFYNDITEYDAIPIVKVHLVAIVPKNHPLAGKKIIKLEELKDNNFISVYEESRIPSYITDCCESVGFTPHIEVNLRRIANVYNYVSKGKGVALLLHHSIENSNFNYDNVVQLDLYEKFESRVLLIKNKDYEVCAASKKLEDYLSSGLVE